jgi:hypothetical protein
MTSIERVARAITRSVITLSTVTVATTPSSNCLDRLRSNKGYGKEGNESGGEVAHVEMTLMMMSLGQTMEGFKGWKKKRHMRPLFTLQSCSKQNE